MYLCKDIVFLLITSDGYLLEQNMYLARRVSKSIGETLTMTPSLLVGISIQIKYHKLLSMKSLALLALEALVVGLLLVLLFTFVSK